jgi:hypothetical protein
LSPNTVASLAESQVALQAETTGCSCFIARSQVRKRAPAVSAAYAETVDGGFSRSTFVPCFGCYAPTTYTRTRNSGCSCSATHAEAGESGCSASAADAEGCASRYPDSAAHAKACTRAFGYPFCRARAQAN